MAVNREALDGGSEPLTDRSLEALVERCEACGATRMRPHMSVAGAMGSEGLIPTTKQFGTALADIVRCSACGHMQLDRFPVTEELDAAYADAASDDYVLEEAGQRESARRVLKRVERYAAPGPLLDLGCWVGFLMAEARDRGWSPIGIEPSAFASDYARDRLGLDVRTEDLLTADLPSGQFTAIVMGDVLEHLTQAGDALDRVAALLAPGGVLVLLLPDAGSRAAKLLGRRWWSVIPTHIHYFTRSSAATMLSRHRFETLDIATDPKAFTVGYYIDKGSGYFPALSRLMHRVANRLGLAKRMWAPDFRDRMVVIARPRQESAARSSSP